MDRATPLDRRLRADWWSTHAQYEGPSESEIKTQHTRFTARLPRFAPETEWPTRPGMAFTVLQRSRLYATLDPFHGVLEELQLIVLLCNQVMTW